MPDSPYPRVGAQVTFPEVEERVLARWEAQSTFRRTVEQRPADNEYVFYDGPPFATGLPHYGNLLTGFVKDAVPRYQTMRGKRVERRFGWDCHGLPAEVAAEQELGVSGRGPVLAYGVDRFNAACEALVLRYTSEWERYVTRQARWVDFANDYKTMDLSYMESVMWAFKELHTRGLLYEGYRVLPYCWECETPLSNFETRTDDTYQDRHDPAVTVLFSVVSPTPDLPGEGPVRVMAWTTTPWTLPSNLALAVGPSISYDVYLEDGVRYVIGTDVAPRFARELSAATLLGSVPGSALVGLHYEPLFPYFASVPNAFVILGGEFVSTEEGTGVVHMAPGFGEDDQRACEAAGIPVVCPVDGRGRFTAEVPDYAGFQVFEANPAIIAALKARGLIVRHEDHVHSYPHCYRTGTPLIYRAVSSWFVAVTQFKDRLLARNQEITWVPGHIKDGSFAKWLDNARDWSITRNRFWGSPIPVWKSDDPRYPRVDVYGSLDSLERDFGVRPTNLHRPFIDGLVRPNPDDPTGKSMMRRVEDVLDCWFESGSMSFAQVHYPFENASWLESHFPADFIVEYTGQVRCWFYVMHVMGVALFDRPAFKTCVAHGYVLGDDGKKLSKSKKNYPDPDEVFDQQGGDALRWALLSSPVLRGGELIVSAAGVDAVTRQVLRPLWNAWAFFTLYANASSYRAQVRSDSPHVLDRYIVAKTMSLASSVGALMDAYDISGACGLITAYLDALTNWYVRRSRARFWDGDPSAFDTLAWVLETVCRLAAPLLPMITEAIWTDLTGSSDGSVHLCDWPVVAGFDESLVDLMDQVRDVCSAASSIRKALGLRVRLPLASITVAGPGASALAPFSSLIADEVNVRTVSLVPEVGDLARWVLTLVPSVLGPRVGADVQKLIGAVKAGQWEQRGTSVLVLDRVLAADEYTLTLTPATPSTARAVGSRLVSLDVTPDPSLEAEGTARDVIRLVQSARRSAGFDVSDRVDLWVASSQPVTDALAAHQTKVMEAVLAVSWSLGGPAPSDWEHVEEVDLDGEPVTIGLRRVPH